uniref:MFS transporter n=1 Tax=Cyberlindnera americana TaxID=36016 RepID=A0A5P8N8G0_9ASCO|nr:MFS transporter [Cyberlindnera americana]
MSEKETFEKVTTDYAIGEVTSEEEPELLSTSEKTVLGDVALQYANKINEENEITPEEEKRVLRKIDLHLMPFLIMSYFLQFLDKSALSQSSVFGLETDLNLVGQQYSWAGSIFYFAYMAGQPVASYMCQRFSISKYVGVCLACWSIILICTVATQNFAGLATIRFFLGFFEAAVSPSWVLLTGSWYLQNEQPVRVAFWYCGNALGVFLGGFLAYGLGHISSGIPSWKWFYILYGIITFFWSIIVFFRLPDSIPNAYFLNDREKFIAVERIRRNKTGVKNEVFKKHQMIEALCDPQIMLLAIIELVGCFSASGISVFGSLIIKSFGFSSVNTMLLQSVSGVIQAGTLLLGGWIIATLPNSATWTQSVAMIPCLIGTCIVNYLPNTPSRNRAGRLVAFWIQYSNTVADVGIFSLMTRNYSGFTKRITANSIIFVSYCVGMIAGPQFFRTSQAPEYQTGFRMMIACWIILMILPMILRQYYIWENKRRDKRDAASGDKEEHVENEEFLDYTDFEQKGFRYSY